MATRGRSARIKGQVMERELAKEFRQWFDTCTTSRYSSKELDDAKVDLCGTYPFNVQSKAVEAGINYWSLLSEMPHNGINVVFHKKNNKGTIVVMTKQDFYEIIDEVCHGQASGIGSLKERIEKRDGDKV